ncbi:coagulation factor XIII B chain [Myotis yumanensis]|uniref:coagulation factor XIII B chain n=1 Tax=Myotis yumanensis TaxID=159337 RepID=UPI0038D486C4
MKPKGLAFMILLTISGELNAEDKPCGLPRVENGRIAVYYYTFESFYFPMAIDQTLSFSCLAGYTTESGKQEDKTTCSAGGWSPQPRCFKKCTRPALTNGHISEAKLLYSVHEKLRYTCASGYKTPAGLAEEEVQCLPDGWSSPPACREEQDTCLAPELLHGNYSTTQTAFRLGDKVRYRCDLGYYTTKGESEEEAECRSHGWFLPPSCTKLVCTPLTSMENGYFQPVKRTYEEGDVVQFFCHENYHLSGPDLVQCYKFGWYPEFPVCQGRRTRCPPPPLPPHAKLKSTAASYHDGEAVFIECQLSFRLRGLGAIRCVNGKWTDPPKCIEEADKIACDEPPEVQHGEAIRTAQTYFNGDRVAYSCQVGFDLRGPREIACELGTWTSPPQCVENFKICQSPPKITHGVIVGDVLPSYPTGAFVEYRCNEYYIMKGERKSSCDHGQWSSPPLCLEPCEVSKEDMESSNIELKWEYEGKVLHGDLIDFVCKPGFDLAPSSPPSGLSVQCSRGQVQYPLCMRKESKGKCGPPPRIDHGLILNIDLLNVSFESGSSVEYRCMTHYFLQGPVYAYCVDGVWTEPPVCLEPCNLSLEEMDRNNLLLKWHYDNRRLIFHGEYTDFVCKINHYMTEVSAFATELRVICDRGKLEYPRCVPRRRMSYYKEPFKT